MLWWTYWIFQQLIIFRDKCISVSSAHIDFGHHMSHNRYLLPFITTLYSLRKMCFDTIVGYVCHMIIFFLWASQEECARLREGVPYVKVYRYNLKHLCPKLNGYGDNGQRKVWSSCVSTHCTCQLTILSISVLECGFILLQVSSH